MPPGGTTAPLNAPRRVSVPSTLCRRMSKTTVCFEVLYTTTRPVSPSATNTGPKVGSSPIICPSASRGRVHVVMRTTTAANATAHLCGRAMLPMSHLLEVSDETEVVRGTDGGGGGGGGGPAGDKGGGGGASAPADLTPVPAALQPIYSKSV